jgi:hypothetical protein
MANLIAPMPIGVVPGSQFWNDWIEKLRTIVNGLLAGISWTNIQNTPTTLSGYGITDGQNISQKDIANGYAGLNSVTRVDKGLTTTDYVIADTSSQGFVMKSPNGHFWLLSISNTGVISTTDLGTTSP